ncbi:DUF3488 and transglutaminase-like domain-containing protein [Mobilicoccus caccae]|uniref:Transglutaminase n=1 Tax=Mobilicoccus caccae TaxID=1859295 RepID=A0ABQ6IQA2_9MICO|nr:DUF3488 and transglutaminase-like domain-containing protein [Mobilicoccus caccae]GMA40059.1 transglutaminase [Mobilicoccus caccae]
MNRFSDVRALRPALLIAIGVMVSAWPLGGLFLTSPWRGPLLGVALTVALVGAGARMLSRSLAPPAQALVLLGALTLLFSEGSALLWVVPTAATLEVARELTADAIHTITTNPAPAPATPGVTFVFTAGFGAVALVADMVGVTLRRPLLAAVPLLIPFLAAVANVGTALPWYHLAALTVVLALLLYDGHRRTLRGWAGENSDEQGTERSFTAAGLVAGALLIAVPVAGVLPHMPTRYLADGFGRVGGGLGQVGFSPSPDLITDLRDDDTTPVLRYRTDDPAPPPIRVATASRFSEGSWEAHSPTAVPSDSPVFSPPPGLSGEVGTEPRTFAVDETRLEAPYLASPGPVVGGTVAGARWNQDRGSQMLVVDDRPSSYSMTYLNVVERTGGDQLSEVRPLLRSGAVTREDLDTGGSTDLLRETLGTVTESATTPAERATAIQNWLRDDPSFTYSLDLPPSGDLGPVDAFLTHRTGYCVQFASVMILMAREEGIPARMATGFLPGTADGPIRTVRADDAHAWPELYLEDLGWVRYEPTPASRTGALAPEYGEAPDTGVADPDGGAAEPTATPTPGQSAPDRRPERDTDPGAPTGADAGAEPTSGDTGGLLTVAGVALLLLLLVAASPLSSAWLHRRRLTRASSDAQRVDEHWRWLDARLADLGIQAPPAATVRTRGETYRRALRRHDPPTGRRGDGTADQGHEGGRDGGLAADAQVDGALTRLVERVETARYGGPAARLDGSSARACREDARTVAGVAWRQADPRRRARAVLAPSDGIVGRLRNGDRSV